VKQVNKTINGINTQGENIADIGGIKESFRVKSNNSVSDSNTIRL